LITTNIYVVLTPSAHGDFIAYVSFLRLYGVWTRFLSTFVVGMFSKHGVYVILKKSKIVEVRGGILQDLHDVMYMSINHGETIDDFKERGRLALR
jgi:hypothetical protein